MRFLHSTFVYNLLKPYIKQISSIMALNTKLYEFKWTPELQSLEERAKGIVITTMNQAKHRAGIRQNLCELAHAAAYAWANHRLSLSSILTPIPITAEKFLIDTITNYWYLAKVFKYFIKYAGYSSDETSQYYYFEAIFSQPSADYPIPQATASVFFRVEECLAEKEKAPLVCFCVRLLGCWQMDMPRANKMIFRTEGHYSDHDVRFVAPDADMILAILQKKLKFFKRLEAMRLF